ncbi:MAG: DUF4430 domain-containing protein [Candidatus Micrarchaeota archaeon]
MKSAYAFIPILALSLLLLGCTQTNPQTEGASISTVTAQPIKINVVIYDGERNLSQQIDAEQGISALRAFQKVANLTIKQYSFGAYVSAVNGLAENKGNNGKYWQYYVDGKLPMVAIDNYLINSSAKLEFRYEIPQPEIK